MNKKKINNCFKDFKDIHKGETIYIIGNGPSLSVTDLNLIKDSTSIAMNRISLIYKNIKVGGQNIIYFVHQIFLTQFGAKIGRNLS